MNPEDELAGICRIFANHGADEKQARIMAKQLLKRAEQISDERGMDRVEALQSLLQAAISGRQGIAPPGFDGKNS